ncbi:hypothetical protein GCM10009557_00270 [Virgisporangium ochraceum]|uniref:Secreted protein/lipoprotein n=1 Tax=Virgisporangium ochraceum TaxID=65505 RepID=A0A8J4A1F8_9ACTN|nr:hypothetical protein [Virgisporangium ochraceum]GIJ74059.1 hypothetical protein Voc01_089760 [Virgisporangium ochraceum]
MRAETPRWWEAGGRTTSALIAGLLVLSGCGAPRRDRSPEPPAVSLAPAATPTPDPSTSAVTAALAAYRSMWTSYIEAGRTTDPQDDAVIGRYADGDALAALQAGLDVNRRDGVIVKGDVTMSPKTTAMTPGKVEVLDCLDTSASTRVKATPGGAPFTDSPGGKRRVTASVRDLAGTWKVISFVPYEVGSC